MAALNQTESPEAAQRRKGCRKFPGQNSPQNLSVCPHATHGSLLPRSRWRGAHARAPGRGGVNLYRVLPHRPHWKSYAKNFLGREALINQVFFQTIETAVRGA